MADSHKLTVLKKLCDHLKGITAANGYDYDLSSAVFRGRATFGQNDPVPMVSVLESPRSDTGLFAGENFSERMENWSLLIQGWAVDDAINPTDPVYGLMDAVENRLFRLVQINGDTGNPQYPDEYLLNRTIGDLRILPGVCRPPMAEVSSKAFFYLPVQLTLVRNTG